MNAFSRVMLWSGLCLSLLGSTLRAADKSTPPNITALARAGRATLEKLATNPASWTVTHRVRWDLAIKAKVVQAGENKFWEFSFLQKSREHPLFVITQTIGLWHILEPERQLKALPYQAELGMSGAYAYISPSDLMCVVDKEMLVTATFEKQIGDVLYFRVPLPSDDRQFFQNMLAELGNMRSPGEKLDPKLSEMVQYTEDILAYGQPITVSEKSGIILSLQIKNLIIKFSDFKWLGPESNAAFQIPTDVKWEDHSRPVDVSELNDLVMVGRDPAYDGSATRPALDSYLLNLKTGVSRRLPYHGSVSMAGTFLKNRREIFVSGLDPMSGLVGLVKIDLISGENTLIASEGGKRMITAEDLSPDGKKMVTMSMLGGERLLDFQVSVLDLATEELKRIGKPVPILSPIAWLPDGDGFVMARTDLVDDPKTIAPRYLCRMDMDGNLKDLRRGSYPVVLHKARRILYEDENDMWHTCDLDGANPKVFADGLKGHGLPSLSPDEKQLLFVYFQKGKSPQLKLFEIGQAEGKSVTPAKGFTTMPVWR